MFARCPRTLSFRATLRLFFAIDLPPAIQEAITQVGHAAVEGESVFRLISPNKLHLTALFLGDVDPAVLGAAEALGASIVQDRSTFPLSVAGLGAFPNLRHPRVVWIGVKQSAVLTDLMCRGAAEATRRGFPVERRAPHPHVTFARAHGVPSGRWSASLPKLETRCPALDFVVNDLVLFESAPGSAYRVVNRFRLLGQAPAKDATA